MGNQPLDSREGGMLKRYVAGFFDSKKPENRDSSKHAHELVPPQATKQVYLQHGHRSMNRCH